MVLAVGYRFRSELRSEGRRKEGCGLGEIGFGGEGRLGEKVREVGRLGETGFGGWSELGGGFGGGAGYRGKKEGRGLGEVKDRWVMGGGHGWDLGKMKVFFNFINIIIINIIFFYIK
ncbi:hypothetical protein D8674_039503 [Pyrus ussuriensis x Pyrus communis]|uniref:Uncharacterized protein n=1 Tax=Pyrus ussuriensis x Pyrus communis TaxID=2448454 RepID=A0A5N5GYP5_9ROSA|nr:hypothetical protein D8674_039503 [Pyrus ussuriensis x Pyrus communis]